MFPKYFSFVFFLLVAISYSCDSSTSIEINGQNSRVDDLYGNWSLSKFINENGNKLSLAKDEKYSINFVETDSLKGQIDCNQYFGNFSAKNGGEISIDLSGITKVYCGEESHDEDYHSALRKVNKYEVNSDELKLGFGSKGILLYKK